MAAPSFGRVLSMTLARLTAAIALRSDPCQINEQAWGEQGFLVMGRALVIFPGSLGDFLCFLPTLQAIGRRYSGERVELMGKREVVGLAVGWSLAAATHSIDRYEVAQLFSYTNKVSKETGSFFSRFSAVYSWTAYGDAHFAAKLKGLVEGPVVMAVN